jgi:membrane associated rhomboid family serine protease
MFRIPTVTKNLLIINVVAFMAMIVLKGIGVDLNGLLGLHFILAPDFQVYQLVTYMFMHASFQHIFFNMFALWMFGCVIENVWGPKKFIFYYIACGVGAGLVQEIAQFGQLYFLAADQIPNFSAADIFKVASDSGSLLNMWTTVGASGAIYAILLAFGMTFPEERIFIFPLPIPIKAKWFVSLYIGVELFSAMGTSGDGVAHFAHLGGMLFGYLLIRYWRTHPGGNTYNDYGFDKGHQFFDNLRSKWEQRSHRSSSSSGSNRGGAFNSHQSDWDYNANKKAQQDEIDRILDKIRRSGYDSLSSDEKRTLFNSSQNNS